MEYYLLPVEEQEVAAIEEALRRVNYDVDDRAFNWSKEETDKIINSMTKETATKIILQFLPEPVVVAFFRVVLCSYLYNL